ncbi:MFS transporter [Actinomadura yumaensis]|uniref:MFS transporter n=1 Tax=Actinomadura yumaensis TaxID=111807 RepID=A0ABW2CYG8_9ACTN
MIPGLAPHLGAATLLRISAEGIATALVLTVQARTGHAATAGYVQTAMTLPYVLSGPVIGHAIDRTTRPRRTALALAAAYAASTAALLATVGRVPLVLALGVAAVIGCTEPVVVAVTGLLPRFVPAGRLSRAYGLEASSYNLAAVAGPGLAAAVAAYAGGSYAGAVIVAASTLGALALPLLPFPPPPPTDSTVPVSPTAAPPSTASSGCAPLDERGVQNDSGGADEPVRPEEGGNGGKGGDGGDGEEGGGGRGGGSVGRGVAGVAGVVVGGLRVLAEGRVLRALTAATTFAWLGFGGVAVTAVLLAGHLGERPSAGGRLLVAMALGSLLGSLASSRWLTPRHAERVMVGGLVAFGASLASLAVVPSLTWAMVAFAAAGLSEGPVFAATLMLRQREAPPERLGEVNTTGGSLKIGASALGAALTAASADLVGPVGLVLTIAGFQFAGAAIGAVLLRRPES